MQKPTAHASIRSLHIDQTFILNHSGSKIPLTIRCVQLDVTVLTSTETSVLQGDASVYRTATHRELATRSPKVPKDADPLSALLRLEATP